MFEPPVNAKLYVPFPVIADVTSNSTQVLTLTEPAASSAFPLGAGALFQFSPLSVHGVDVAAKLFETEKTEPPSGPASITRRRSVALWTDPVTPDTLNLR